tara:strand:+ start:75792 stop:76268 length:477 start_codon:yes stop_codon:yes gene_type:complete
MEDNSPIKQALDRWLNALNTFTHSLGLDEDQSHTLFKTFDLFEDYMTLKYGLLQNTGNMSFAVASEIPVTGDSNPLNGQEDSTKEEETTKNMFQKESGLQTGALDTTCSIGKWKGQTFREMLESPEGESAVRVIAMSQLPSAKTAKIVVNYHDGVAQE